MAAQQQMITCSKTLQNTFFFESSTLKIGWGGLQLTTQAPKTLFWAKTWRFLAIFGQKCGFFGDGGSKTIDNVLQNLAKHVFFESGTLKIGYGALQLTTQAPKTLF